MVPGCRRPGVPSPREAGRGCPECAARVDPTSREYTLARAISGKRRNAQRGEALARGGHRAFHVDAAARILDHGHGKPFSTRILGGVAYAEIERQPGNEDAREASLAQIAG